MDVKIAVYNKFNLVVSNKNADKSQIVSAYNVLKKGLGIKSVTQLHTKTKEICLQSLSDNEIDQKDLDIVCNALTRVAKNIHVIKDSERTWYSFLSDIFTPEKKVVRNLYQTEVVLKDYAYNIKKYDNFYDKPLDLEYSFENLARLLPASSNPNVSKREEALKLAEKNYDEAKRFIKPTIISTFTQNTQQYYKDLLANKSSNKVGNELVKDPNFAELSKKIYIAFASSKDPVEKLDNMCKTITENVSEKDLNISADFLIEYIPAIMSGWSEEQAHEFMREFVDITESSISEGRMGEDSLEAAKRSYFYTNLIAGIRLIQNQNKI